MYIYDIIKSSRAPCVAKGGGGSLGLRTGGLSGLLSLIAITTIFVSCCYIVIIMIIAIKPLSLLLIITIIRDLRIDWAQSPGGVGSLGLRAGGTVRGPAGCSELHRLPWQATYFQKICLRS